MQRAGLEGGSELRSSHVDQRAESVLARAASGDPAAWDELVDAYAALVWSVVRGFRFDDATSHDVSQTVWLRLAEHCGRIRDPERLASWLATTARNECLRVVRAGKRLIPSDEVIELLGQASSADAEIDASLLADEESAEVLAAYSTLDPETRGFLRLFCLDPPLTYQEISSITGRPIGSIGPTRRRSLEKLRHTLNETWDDRSRPDA